MVCAAFAPHGAAFAQDPAADEARAKELYTNGRISYEEGRYEDAIAAWEEAYRLSNRVLLMFNIANAYERIGEYQRAIDALSRYRAFAPEDEREMLDRRLRNLELRLAEQEAAAAATVVTRPVETEPVDVPEAPPDEPTRSVEVVPWVLVGLGGVTLGTGLGFGAAALGARSDAAALCAPTGVCPESAASKIKADRTLALVSDLATGVGLATAGIGVVFVFVSAPAGRPWSVGPNLRNPGLTVDARF